MHTSSGQDVPSPIPPSVPFGVPPEPPRFPGLLRRVARRAYLQRFSMRFARAFLFGCAGVFLILLATRLGGLFAEPKPFILCAGATAAVALFTAFFTRPLSSRETARLLDARSGSRDLFLTATLASETSSGFAPIVLAQAEERAAQIEPSKVVHFDWRTGTRNALGALTVLALAFAFLPRLDPFGKTRQRAKLSQAEQHLAELKKATVARTEQLAAEGPGPRSEEVKKALAALEKTFREAQPREREKTLAALAQNQKDLGQLWRKTASELPKDAFEKATQSFGKTDARQIEKWREELKKGDASSMQKAIENLRADMKALDGKADSAEKRAQQQQIAQQLAALSEAAKQAGASAQANTALSRALEQLSNNATRDAMESLNLSQKELEQLASAMKDQQSVEDALKAAQMAKQLAAEGKLGAGRKPGEGEGEGMSMADYAALFEQKMAGKGRGKGEGGDGMGEGEGNGAKRPEDESAKTAFKSEKDKGPLSGGKMLMQWKTKEVGETGARTEEYLSTMREVKQGVSEAIASEQVPPGYHAAIQKYFDALPAR